MFITQESHSASTHIWFSVIPPSVQKSWFLMSRCNQLNVLGVTFLLLFVFYLDKRFASSSSLPPPPIVYAAACDIRKGLFFVFCFHYTSLRSFMPRHLYLWVVFVYFGVISWRRWIQIHFCGDLVKQCYVFAKLLTLFSSFVFIYSNFILVTV